MKKILCALICLALVAIIAAIALTYVERLDSEPIDPAIGATFEKSTGRNLMFASARPVE
jgi:hypothetical protein